MEKVLVGKKELAVANNITVLVLIYNLELVSISTYFCVGHK